MKGLLAVEWETILDAIPDAVSIIDRDSRFVYLNRAMARFIGLPPAEIVGRLCFELVHCTTERISQCPCAHMKDRLETAELDVPERGIRVRVTVDPILGEDGALAGAVHIVTDITEASRMKEEAVFEARRLEMMDRIVMSLMGDFESGTVLRETARELCLFLGLSRCTILLLEDPDRIVEHREPGFPSIGPMISGILDRVSASEEGRSDDGDTRAVNDVRECPGYPDGRSELERARLGSYLLVPLRTGKDRQGALVIDRPVSHAWTEREIQTAEAIARKIAIAVRHCRIVEEQQELSKRLFSLMNNVPGAVYRGLRDWSVLLMGAEVERFTGYSPEDVTHGRINWQTLLHPEDLGRIKEAFRQAVKEKRRILRVEYRIRHRDGSIRWVADRRQLIYDGSGEFAYVDGLLLDITDRRHAEEQRSVTGEKLRALIESSPLPIMALDPEGKVILWSRAAESYFGWKEEEVLGRVLPLVPEAGLGEFRALLARVLAGERVAGIGRRRKRKDGTPVEISVSAAPLYDPDGSVVGIMSVVVDMTERRAMEEALLRSEEKFLQSQKLEAVGRLAGGVAHDFNNLLTAIRGYSDLLLQRLEAESPHRREIEEIQKAGDRAASLTQQLLAFSRKQILEPKKLDLNEVVGDMDRMLRRLIGEDLEFLTVLCPGLWTVKADPGQIEQVIMNLAVNARDAMPRGGTLTVETANVEIDDAFVRRHPEAEAGPHVLLAISDTGCGMDEETKARLFEPFFTTKEKGKGTGLGLATVYGIVTQSSGFIRVDSEAEKGTVFRIYLPRCEERFEDRPVPALQGGEIPMGRETILLVEDEEMVRELARTILEENGYTVLIASDGEEALGIVDRNLGPIHLLLTDVVMPRMGGVDLARAIALRKSGLKVIYMTGYADTEVVQDGGIDSGCQLLRKPFRVDGLLRKVGEVLHG